MLSRLLRSSSNRIDDEDEASDADDALDAPLLPGNDEDTDAAPAPTYADGSFTEIVSEDGVASATISVGGQGCVYQVWSFLGEDHLRGLIEGLRIVAVEPQAAADSAFAAR